jgi:hypothetical protein
MEPSWAIIPTPVSEPGPSARDKLANSPADYYWVFVLQDFASRSTDFAIVPPKVLSENLAAVRSQQKMIQTYIWVTGDRKCWETRGLRRAEQLQVAQGSYQHPHRDLTRWLNNWEPIAPLNG